MNRRRLCHLLFCLSLLFAAGSASAHQPRLVGAGEPPPVIEPEISKAYYGRLDGVPQFYRLSSAVPFDLYVNILTPKTADARFDWRVEILADKKTRAEVIGDLSAPATAWREFYEPFGGDRYWQGPEWRGRAGPGDYIIKVQNPDFRGRYALAIGEREEFPPREILNALILVPQLKRDFFDQSAFTVLLNKNAIYLFIALAFTAGGVYVLMRIMKWLALKLKDSKPTIDK